MNGMSEQHDVTRPSRHAGRGSRTSTPFVLLDRSRCEACWSCVDACPKEVLGKLEFLWHKHAVVAHAERCTGCRACLGVCVPGALSGADG
jgi:2-oxoglutarate ferredoxin oxidoreductase subunit delta